MSYEDYDSSSVEAGGNILCVNPDGVDRLSQTVVDGTFQYVCQKCGKPLDRWYNGEWVAKYPERTKDGGGIRGYSISQMNAVWINFLSTINSVKTGNSKYFKKVYDNPLLNS